MLTRPQPLSTLLSVVGFGCSCVGEARLRSRGRRRPTALLVVPSVRSTRLHLRHQRSNSPRRAARVSGVLGQRVVRRQPGWEVVPRARAASREGGGPTRRTPALASQIRCSLRFAPPGLRIRLRAPRDWPPRESRDRPSGLPVARPGAALAVGGPARSGACWAPAPSKRGWG
jgi:hypothetical protein